jgi:hypothetical protein
MSIALMAIAAIALAAVVLLDHFFAWFCIISPRPCTTIILCGFGNTLQYYAILKYAE